MRFDRRNPPKALVIAVMVLLAVGIGFLADFLITCAERAAYPQEYETYVTASAERYGVPKEVIYAVIKCESDFESGAVSSAGAVGLMQMLPSTFEWLTNDILFEHLEPGMLYDPETNIRYGTCYLARLYDRYADWELVFAAYNAGPGTVDGWLEDPAYTDGNGGLAEIPYKETRRHIKKITRAWDMYERLYGE